jgi:hypothetical protein
MLGIGIVDIDRYLSECRISGAGENTKTILVNETIDAASVWSKKTGNGTCNVN